MVDFAPGAFMPLHTHGGLTLITVLDGQMTRRAHGADHTFSRGESWVEYPDEVHAAGNQTRDPATILVTFLLPAGATATTVAAGAPSPAQLPTRLPRTGVGNGAIPLISLLGAAAVAAGHFLRRGPRLRSLGAATTGAPDAA